MVVPLTRPMPQQHYQQLLLAKANTSNPWDCELASNLTIQDLDEAEIIRTLNESIQRGRTMAKFKTNNPKEALQTLGLLKNSGILNAAGILFHHCTDFGVTMCDHGTHCPRCGEEIEIDQQSSQRLAPWMRNLLERK